MDRRHAAPIAIVLVVILVVAAGQVAFAQAWRETLVQTSTIDALLVGVFDGPITCGELCGWGDFGIGTFNGLDGEMIGFDGSFWQIKADGKAYEVSEDMHTPFAAVTYFDADLTAEVPEGTTFEQLGEVITQMAPGPNFFYAIRVEGTFSHMKTRSVPGQDRPYPPLVEVTRNQPEFEFENVSGTIAGFRCPSYVQGINVPGDHLHFINDARTGGGHILSFTVKEATVTIDTTPGFLLLLPEHSEAFRSADLSEDRQDEVHEAESE